MTDAGEELVAVPRSLLGAACAAIRGRRGAPNNLSQLNRYAVHGPALAKPASSPAGAQDRHAVQALMKAVQRAEDGAGTLPAKEAVKLRPADWHAVCDRARDIAAISLSTSAAEPVDSIVERAVASVKNLDDWASMNETEFTGWGEGDVPPGATFMRVKSGQALRALMEIVLLSGKRSKRDV